MKYFILIISITFLVMSYGCSSDEKFSSTDAGDINSSTKTGNNAEQNNVPETKPEENNSQDETAQDVIIKEDLEMIDIKQYLYDVFKYELLSSSTILELPKGWYADEVKYIEKNISYRHWYDIYNEKNNKIGMFEILDRKGNTKPKLNHVSVSKDFNIKTKIGDGTISILERDIKCSSLYAICALIPSAIDNTEFYYRLYFDVPNDEDVQKYKKVTENILSEQ